MKFDKLNLYAGGTLLGTLKYKYLAMPWFFCDLSSTEAFEEVKSLFDKEVELLNSDNFGQNQGAWEEKMAQIDDLTLSLIEVNTGEKIEDFLLHIENGEAWFWY